MLIQPILINYKFWSWLSPLKYKNKYRSQMNSIDKKMKQLNNKMAVHQVINLDEGNNFVPSVQQDLFVADLAYQCGNLLTWVADPSSQLLSELLWKNKMRVKASQRFSNFDSDEIRKLVDRDWRVMSEESKKAIILEFKKSQDPNSLKNRVEKMKRRLQQIKQRNQ